MGYTHYWYKLPKVPQDKYEAICVDTKNLIDAIQPHIKICGWDGTGDPEITSTRIAFNGDANCGHDEHDLGIAWPAHGASGVSETPETNSNWFAGAELQHRSCGGDCAHESFSFNRVHEMNDWDTPSDGKYFSCCKTAFKPYDILVTAVLIVAKHHLEDDIRVASDGEDADWNDGKELCQSVLGYGNEYEINEEGRLEKVSDPQETPALSA